MTQDTIEGKSPVTPKRPFFRLGLSALLSFVLLCAVVLGLVTQFKHVGFVASCFILGIAAAWWLQRWRLTAASLTALLVFIVTYVACWVRMGFGTEMHYQAFVGTALNLWEISDALSKYAEATGELPDSLQDMTDLEGHEVKYSQVGQWLDGWLHPLHYQKKADGFELASLGRDGKLGGVGLDADVFLGDDIIWTHGRLGSHVSYAGRAKARLPLSQFLFETPGSGSVFLAALVASILAGSIWLTVTKGQQVPIKWLIFGVAITTISAIVVAVFLAAFHVALSQSGH